MRHPLIVDYSAYPRSVLKSLPPLHFGTALVESLDGYAERLISRHDIPRRDLERFIDGDIQAGRGWKKAREPINPDVSSVAAEIFACRLAEFTRQPSVARLGFGWMTEVLPTSGLLKQQRAWCSICLGEAHHERREHYMPLIWSLKSVEACAVHGVLLSIACDSCGGALRLRSSLKFPFEECPHCGQQVFKSAEHSRPLASRARDDQLVVCNQLGEMLAKLPLLKAALIRPPSLRRVIASCKVRGLGGTEWLCRTASISKATLSAMLHETRVSLEIWVRVAVAADVSLAGLFASDLWRENISGKTFAWRPLLSPRNGLRPIDWVKLRATARATIKDGSSEGFYAFCRQMKVDPKRAKVMLGKLREQLNSAAEQAKSARQAHSIKSMEDQIVIVEAQFEKTGRRLSARAVARQLTVPRHSYVFEKAYATFTQQRGRSVFEGCQRTQHRDAKKPSTR